MTESGFKSSTAVSAFVEPSGIATITLEGPNVGNMLDLAAARELRLAAELCADARVVVLRSLGAFFCVGGDLSTFTGRPEVASSVIRETAQELHTAILALRSAPAPVIAAVQGPAAGAGLSLVAASDYAIATRDASFVFAYSAVGLSPDGGASYFLPRLIGTRRTLEMAVTNRRLSAMEAQSWGLINKLVESDELDDALRDMAQKVAAGPVSAFGVVRDLVEKGWTNDLRAQLQLEENTLATRAGTAEGREGINAFLEKRPARHRPER